MSESTHEEAHTGPIKNPKQLLIAVFFSFVVPVFIIIGLVYYVTSGAKPAGTTDASAMSLSGVSADDRAKVEAAICAHREGEEARQRMIKGTTAEDVAAPYIATGAKPRVAILREQGVNGQIEMASAFDRAGFVAVDVHMSDLIAGRDHTVVTRTRGLDAIPFSKRLRFDMESSFGTDIRNPWNHLGYSAVMFWYAKPGATSNRLIMSAEAAKPIMSLVDDSKNGHRVVKP